MAATLLFLPGTLCDARVWSQAHDALCQNWSCDFVDYRFEESISAMAAKALAQVTGTIIVPIVADEARTFGMANLFRQAGIYSSVGQKYSPEDIGSVLSYREAQDGQILEEGISEAGAIASWTAAATSYSVHGLSMLPFYICYSMFGFQRVGDQIWAAADQRARLPAGRDVGPDDAGRRGPAASGRHQPPGCRDGSKLPGLGSRLRG